MIKKKYNDDLFKETTMTFGEHLEELRVCLWRAIVGLMIGFGIGLFFGQDIVQVINAPLKEALEEFFAERDLSIVKERLDKMAADGTPVPEFSEIEGLVQHDHLVPIMYYVDPRELIPAMQAGAAVQPDLTRLREGDVIDLPGLCKELLAASKRDSPSPAKRLWELMSEVERAPVGPIAAGEPIDPAKRRALVAAWEKVLASRDFYRAEDFASFTDEVAPTVQKRAGLSNSLFNRRLLAAAYPELVAGGARISNMARMFLWIHREDDPRTSLKVLSAQEAFMIYLKASLVLGAVLSSPWIFWQVWGFVAAGLYPHERNYVYFYLPMSLGLFLAGAALAYFYVFEPVLNFLLWFNRSMGLVPDMRISEWLGFALMMPIAFGVSFQLPLVMLFLQRIGIFTVKSYTSKWRMAVLVICVLSMFLSPGGDPYSMMLMAVPLVFLYYFGIALCKFLPRNRAPL